MSRRCGRGLDIDRRHRIMQKLIDIRLLPSKLTVLALKLMNLLAQFMDLRLKPLFLLPSVMARPAHTVKIRHGDGNKKARDEEAHGER
jgi:hypothetical protein